MLQDRYEILEKIGSGGMSDVYKAKCHKLNRLVAIKVLKSEFTSDATFVSKFKMEAQAAAGLSHPNIVNIHNVVDVDNIRVGKPRRQPDFPTLILSTSTTLWMKETSTSSLWSS